MPSLARGRRPARPSQNSRFFISEKKSRLSRSSSCSGGSVSSYWRLRLGFALAALAAFFFASAASLRSSLFDMGTGSRQEGFAPTQHLGCASGQRVRCALRAVQGKGAVASALQPNAVGPPTVGYGNHCRSSLTPGGHYPVAFRTRLHG